MGVGALLPILIRSGTFEGDHLEGFSQKALFIQGQYAEGTPGIISRHRKGPPGMDNHMAGTGSPAYLPVEEMKLPGPAIEQSRPTFLKM
jgi:hypothetical protein